uniref:ATP synthase subunit 8 n=1 Tax=Chrysis pseudobrevitarsis TaxID=913302 RepID=A0A1D9CJG2_9HYME|nr:ATP synthase subunit 8 [Chrysis pseudobrevitarsis]
MPQMSPMNWLILMFYFLMLIYFSIIMVSYMNFYMVEKGKNLEIYKKYYKNKW